MRTIVWFRGKDLRIADQAPLRIAADSGEVLPLFVLDLYFFAKSRAQEISHGDWARNNVGWQWSAGCGWDAQPYFRVFNPVTQGKKFDSEGDYVRRWVPELAKMPARHIHCPWDAPETTLADAGVDLGDNYPRPVVDHKQARQRYLDATGAYLKGGKR